MMQPVVTTRKHRRLWLCRPDHASSVRRVSRWWLGQALRWPPASCVVVRNVRGDALGRAESARPPQRRRASVPTVRRCAACNPLRETCSARATLARCALPPPA